MNYDNFQRGEYEVGDRVIYFRSKWEAEYATYLEWLKRNKQIKDWNYECKIFVFDKIRHGTTRYIPDFEITENDGTKVYHECKGYMDSRSKTKLKRMAKYYPEVKLVLIDGAFIKDLRKKLNVKNLLVGN